MHKKNNFERYIFVDKDWLRCFSALLPQRRYARSVWKNYHMDSESFATYLANSPYLYAQAPSSHFIMFFLKSIAFGEIIQIL